MNDNCFGTQFPASEVSGMGKNRRKWSESQYRKYIKEGRGQGTGADYIPWIKIHDFPSSGVCARIRGRTTGRIHHLLSRNESAYFYLLDCSPEVSDIREQFPLRLQDTLDIARSLGIRHPWDHSSGFPIVMTTDFLITTPDGPRARTVKETDALSDARVLEKFAIEHAYWKRHAVDWKIVTEKQIEFERSRNLQWLYYGQSLDELLPDCREQDCVLAAFLDLYETSGLPLPDAIEILESCHGLQPGVGMSVFKKLIILGLIHLDLSQRIDPAGMYCRKEQDHEIP